MPQMNMVQAINDALRHEMRRDNRVVILGEDVGKVGGVFRVTQGLFDEFGDERGGCFDAPAVVGVWCFDRDAVADGVAEVLDVAANASADKQAAGGVPVGDDR